MAHSARDPATKGRPARNAGRRLGAERARKPSASERSGSGSTASSACATSARAVDSKLRSCDVAKLERLLQTKAARTVVDPWAAIGRRSPASPRRRAATASPQPDTHTTWPLLHDRAQR